MQVVAVHQGDVDWVGWSMVLLLLVLVQLLGFNQGRVDNGDNGGLLVAVHAWANDNLVHGFSRLDGVRLEVARQNSVGNVGFL